MRKDKRGIVDCNYFPIFTWIISIIIIIIVIVFSLFQGYIKPLQSQLSECQENVPSCDMEYGRYGFKVICYDDFFGESNIGKVIDKHHYGYLERCQASLESFQDYENCEVLNIGEKRK